jgi:acyl carrier protein
MEREQFYSTMREYLRKDREGDKEVDPKAIEALGPDDNLWDLGYLDSFGMVRLLTFLEDLLGHELVLSSDSLRTFHTLARIYDTHVAVGTKAEA